MYKYYVSYAFDRGFGSAEFTTPKPITTYEQVLEMSEKIRQKEGYKGNVIILNYILLDEVSN